MITAQDIREKTFEKSTFGGYAMNEVDDFLDEMANDVAVSQKELATMRAKMKVLVEKIEEYRGSEEDMHKALVSAQKTARTIEEEAKARADALLSEAQAKADAIVAEAQAQACEHHNENGNKNDNADVNADICSVCEKPYPQGNKQAELYAEAEQIAHDGADGHYQSREIHLAEHALVSDERVGSLVQTVGEVEPAHVARHVEQRLWHAVGTHVGDASEDHHVHDDRQDGLDEIP